MFSDILVDLGIEKIRKDFGDVAATVFSIIIHNGGCSFEELNFLIPRSDYSVIRFSILTLFQHNIVFLSPKSDPTFKNLQIIAKIKILPRLHECIYRFRYSRFFALVEHEYGLIGRRMTEIFYEKGQLLLGKVFAFSCLKKANKFKAENVLIQIARDGFIEPLFFNLGSKNFNVFQKTYFKKFKKPIQGRKTQFWKLSSLKLNLTIRINLIMSIVSQYYGQKFNFILRSCFSKIINFNCPEIFKCWFSLDSLADNIKEVLKNHQYSEMSVIEIFETRVMDRSLFTLKNSRIKISLNFFFEIIRNKILENLIGNQFGKNFLRIFKILSRDLENDEKQISSQCLLDESLIRKELFKMYRLGFVSFEEKNNSFFQSGFKKNLIWKTNFSSIKKRFISEILKSMYNLLLKLENLQLLFSKIFFFFKGQSEKLKNHFKTQRLGLLISLLRLDELLIMVYS